MIKYLLKEITCIPRSNGFIDGIKLNRELTIDECRHIMYVLLGINILNSEDAYDEDEYYDYNEELKSNVNKWFAGEVDDTMISDYAYDCSDEPLGMFNLIPILHYLQEIDAL